MIYCNIGSTIHFGLMYCFENLHWYFIVFGFPVQISDIMDSEQNSASMLVILSFSFCIFSKVASLSILFFVVSIIVEC
jgi:predicted Na+-dependent transporter